jgi:hypothetical protein
MDKFKALSLVLLGMVIGLGYAVACGSDEDNGTAPPMLPGVGVAMAQGSCAQWEVRLFSVETIEQSRAGFQIEPGWTPLGVVSAYSLFATRCAQ